MRTYSIDRGLLLLRVALGVVFVMHGGQKLFVMGPSTVAGFLGSIGVPFPYLNAILVTAAELGGGLALLAGAFTRIAGLLTAFTMAVAFATVHGANGFFLPAGFEFVFTLFLASLTLVLAGPGAYSVDAKLFRRVGRDALAAPAGAPDYRHAA
jgi:putative oxidoreductase